MLLTINIHGQDTSALPTRQDTLKGSITPERRWWDLLHYDLTIKPDYENKTITGSNTIQYKIVEAVQTKGSLHRNSDYLLFRPAKGIHTRPLGRRSGLTKDKWITATTSWQEITVSGIHQNDSLKVDTDFYVGIMQSPQVPAQPSF
jgi:hypothetical protein